MRNILIAATFAVAATACHTPTEPDAVCTTDADCAAWEAKQGIPEIWRTYGAPAPAAPAILATHNSRATAQDGRIVYVCATQPRRYSTGWEVDHYIADNPCPARPID